MVGSLASFLLLFLLIPSKCHGFDVQYCDPNGAQWIPNQELQRIPKGRGDTAYFNNIMNVCGKYCGVLNFGSKSSCFYQTVWQKEEEEGKQQKMLEKGCEQFAVDKIMLCRDFARKCHQAFKKGIDDGKEDLTTIPTSPVAKTESLTSIATSPTPQKTTENGKTTTSEESKATTPLVTTKSTSTSTSTKNPKSSKSCLSTDVYLNSDELCKIFDTKPKDKGFSGVRTICEGKCKSEGVPNEICVHNCMYQSAYIKHKDDHEDIKYNMSNEQAAIELFCELIHTEKESNKDCMSFARRCYDTLVKVDSEKGFKGPKCKVDAVATIKPVPPIIIDEDTETLMSAAGPEILETPSAESSKKSSLTKSTGRRRPSRVKSAGGKPSKVKPSGVKPSGIKASSVKPSEEKPSGARPKVRTSSRITVEEEPTEASEEPESENNDQRKSRYRHKLDLSEEHEKDTDGPNVNWLWILLPILLVLGIIVVVALVLLKRRRMKKAKEHGLLPPSASDVEAGILKRPKSSQQKTGRSSGSTNQKSSDVDTKPIEAEKIEKHRFKQEGPLKVDVGLKGKQVKHTLEGAKSNPLDDVTFDEALNRLVKIGSNVEKLASTEVTGEDKKTGSTPVMVDKTRTNTTTKSVDNTTQTQTETVEKTLENKTEEGGGEKK